jgi:ParB family chromosome partitioning protein
MDATLPLSRIYPNPNQPRTTFDEEKLEELAMSIRAYGVLEPIVVAARGDRFMIVSGERRYRASMKAGLTDIPARVVEADDALVEELALLENIQRQDLNVIEEARAYKALLDRGCTKEALAAKMGMKQAWRIDERTSLLNLSERFQEMAVKGALGHSQAFEMSRVDADAQETVFCKIRNGELRTYNKLRAFVDGLIAVRRQESIFAFTLASMEERTSIEEFETLLRNVERFLSSVQQKGRFGCFRKAVFHSQLSAERIDLVIQNLMRLRKAVLEGAGVKDAGEAANG